MSKEILIIVDVVNGFIKEGNLADPKIANIIPNIESLAKSFIEDKKDVIAFRDCHTLDSPELEAFPEHCILGSGEEELVDELKALQDDFMMFDKNATSAFVVKEFMDYIESLDDLERVIIVGCCTDICIMNLAIPLKNHFNHINKKVDIIVPKDSVDTYHIEGIHDRDEWNEMAYRFMLQAGVKLVDTFE